MMDTTADTASGTTPFDIDDLVRHVLGFVGGASLLQPASLALRLVSRKFRDAMDQHVITTYNSKSLGASALLLSALSGLRHLSFCMGWALHNNHKDTLPTLLDSHQSRVTSLWIDGRLDLCHHLQHFTALRSLRITNCACDQQQASSFNEGLRSLSALTHLSLVRTPVSTEALQNKPCLCTLNITGAPSRATDSPKSLTHLTQLHTLTVSDANSYIDIARLSHLTRLVIGGDNSNGYFDGGVVKTTCALTQLKSLSICIAGPHSSALLNQMSRSLTRLTDLSLPGKQTIDVRDLVPFASLCSLGLKKLRPLTRYISSESYRPQVDLPNGRTICLYGVE